MSSGIEMLCSGNLRTFAPLVGFFCFRENYFYPMKITSPQSKIEFLDSQHLDKGVERVPSIKTWQLLIAQTSFQTVGHLFPTFMAKQAYKIFSTPRWRAKHKQPDDLIRAAKIIDFSFEGHTIKLYEWANCCLFMTAKTK